MIEPPRSVEFDDVYFSAHDGAAETKHVFFDGNNLPSRWQGEQRFTVAETGFGTGLNFLLCWKLFDETAPKDAFLDYISIEKFPLPSHDIRKGLKPWVDSLNPYLEKMLGQYPMRVPGFHRIVFDNRVALTLIFDDVNDALPEVDGDVDAWFLDGFTPSKNPDMWTDDVFRQMARLSHHETTFATFTAAGFVKRGLQAAGFEVQKQKGFAHKRDMLMGVFEGSRPRKIYPRPRNILIHGAGLAGCAAAYVLAQYGIKTQIYDPNGVAFGASGNFMGLINPRFSAFRCAESDFYTAAFCQSVREFSKMDNIGFSPCGSLHLIHDEGKEKRLGRAFKNWGWHCDHMQYVGAEIASEIAGIKIEVPALYLPQSAQLNPRALCEHYTKNINIVKQKPDGHELEILAIGAGGVTEKKLLDIPLHTVRGQITKVVSSSVSKNLKTNICYSGYISACHNGQNVVGSTFQKWLIDMASNPEDDIENLFKLSQNIPVLTKLSAIESRASLRTATNDRFPVVGKISSEENTFVTIAHGSHGIISSFAAAHLLADMMRGGVKSLSQTSINALSPQRFLRRQK